MAGPEVCELVQNSCWMKVTFLFICYVVGK
jgi:hypothetical protein